MLIRKLLIVGCFISLLNGCYRPPYNHFERDHYRVRHTSAHAGVGAGVGATVGAFAGNTLLGAAIGGGAGTALGLYKTNKDHLLKDLQQQDIQHVEYGNMHTLVVPTDKYFHINSPRLKELCYPGLANILRLLRYYPNSTIYIGSFTDNIGYDQHKKKLTQARAEAMVAYLWANGIPAHYLDGEGYGQKHAVSNNQTIHGSAQNRRLEIQWYCDQLAEEKQPDDIGLTK